MWWIRNRPRDGESEPFPWAVPRLHLTIGTSTQPEIPTSWIATLLLMASMRRASPGLDTEAHVYAPPEVDGGMTIMDLDAIVHLVQCMYRYLDYVLVE